MGISKSEHSGEGQKPHGKSQGLRPLAVPVRTACALVGIGNTKMWELIKDGRVETISIGRKRLVIYNSLENLVG